jgi:hypothetical protein
VGVADAEDDVGAALAERAPDAPEGLTLELE